jgi:hypothetical protein
MSANTRFEFITVTASAYDAATMASKLTAHSAEGWEVVAIVPTGGELTAFCRRPATTDTAAATAAQAATPAATPAATAPVTPADLPAAAANKTVAVSVPPVAVTTPAAQAPSATPAGWYSDPSGRYELRYWDGTAWTEHVARGGQQYTDPPVA